MMTWIIVGLILAGIVGFFMFGSYLQKKTRAEAPANLEKAKVEFAAGNHNESLRLVAKAFYVPGDDKYDANDATTALGVVLLFEKIYKEMNIDLSSYTDKLKTALEKISATGGEIPDSLTKPLEELLEKVDSDEDIAELLMSEFRGGKNIIEEGSEGPYPDDDYPTDTINKVGKFMISGKVEDAIATATAGLDTDNEALKAALLDQRGGCYFMKKDYQSAINDYKEAANLRPLNPGYWINLAEAYQYAGNKTDAVNTAQHVLTMAYLEKRDRETAKAVIKKLS